MFEGLPNTPRLAEGLVLVDGPGEAVQIRGVYPPLRLTGSLAAGLLPLLDGTRSVEQLMGALGSWRQEEVAEALRALAERGLLEEGAGAPPRSPRTWNIRAQNAFYRAVTLGPPDRGEQIRKALGAAQIALFGWGRLGHEVESLLKACGARRLTARLTVPSEEWPELVSWPIDLVLLALPRPAPALLEAFNARCLERGRAFLPVAIDGPEATVGPLVLPGRSACYACFQGRLHANTPFPAEEAAFDDHLNRAPIPEVMPEWPPFTSAVAALAVMDAVRHLTGFAPAVTVSRVCTLDARTGLQRSTRVWKLPRCPVCGDQQGGGSPDGP